MAGFDISVIGFPDLQAKFAALPEAIQVGPLRKGLRSGAKVFEAAIVAEAPRFTGAMAMHASVRSIGSRRRGVEKLIVRTGTKQELGIPERTKAGAPRGYYPTAIHFGWYPKNGSRSVFGTRERKETNFTEGQLRWLTAHGIADRTGKRTGKFPTILPAKWRRAEGVEFGARKVPPNPFIRRAFDRMKSQALAAVAATITAEIPKAVEKALGKSAAANAAAVAE